MRQVIILQADHYVLFKTFGIIYPFAFEFIYLCILYQYICRHIYYIHIYTQIFHLSVHQ